MPSEKAKAVAVYNSVLPFWKYCLMVLATIGVYGLWWFYRTWAFVKDVNNIQGIWARVGATVGTALPIFNLFFLWKMLSGVRRIATENKLPSRFSVRYLFVVYQLFLIGRFVFDRFDNEVSLQTGPEAVSYFALSLVLLFAPLLALYPVQRSINDYWRERQNLPERKSLTTGEIVVTVLGCCLWLLVSYRVYLTWTGQMDSAGNPVTQQTTRGWPTK